MRQVGELLDSRPGLHRGAVQSLGGAGGGAADRVAALAMALLSWADLSYVLPVTSVGYVLAALVGAVLAARADHRRRAGAGSG